MSTIFKRNTTISEWEKEFTSISGRKNPGYNISVFQKEIAAKGDVLVLVGAHSTYQESARNMYNKLHSMRKVVIRSRSSLPLLIDQINNNNLWNNERH